MLFRRDVLDGIVSGRIDRVYRRWSEPRARVGGRQRTQVGVIEFTSVEPADLASLGEADAAASGHPSLEALIAAQAGTGELYRIGVRHIGEDPRIALRESTTVDADERRAIDARLAGMDARSPRGPWARDTLRLLAENPGVRAADLAATAGVETQPWKRDVRKLKELGLTESLELGYRLSPRGRAYLDGP